MTDKHRLICIIRTEEEVAAFDKAAAGNAALWSGLMVSIHTNETPTREQWDSMRNAFLRAAE